MTKLKTFVLTALAASTIGVGSLAAPPTASAMPRYTCPQANSLAQVYMGHALAFVAAGDLYWAGVWRGRAAQLVDTYC